jgi:hypothetical protein
VQSVLKTCSSRFRYKPFQLFEFLAVQFGRLGQHLQMMNLPMISRCRGRATPVRGSRYVELQHSPPGGVPLGCPAMPSRFWRLPPGGISR